jgi:hypothetical protein
LHWAPDLAHYTESLWEQEMKSGQGIEILFSDGRRISFGTNLPCPDCKTVGFYGPRLIKEGETITRKYRACKFCGFWQEAAGAVLIDHGSKPYRCNHFYCDKCGNYGWRSPWNEGNEICPCGAEMRRATWPVEDPQHWFNKIKQQALGTLQKVQT